MVSSKRSRPVGVWFSSTLAAFIVFILSSIVPAGATVVRPASVGILADQADVVIHGRVTDRWVVPKRGPRGEIYTRTRIEVIEYFRGDGPREHTIQQLGGELGGFEMNVIGSPELNVDQEVVLFLTVDQA